MSGATAASNTSSFQKRILQISFTFGPPSAQAGNQTAQQKTFDGTNNQLTLTGLRASVAVNLVGGASQGSCDARIFGMTQDHMNKLTLAGGPLSISLGNVVSIAAGTPANGLSLVYAGTIARAVADYSGVPDVCFQVTGLSSLQTALQAAPPLSYAGAVDVATVMANLAKLMGYSFQNSGVQVAVSNPYLHGSYYSQVEQLAKMAQINFFVDPTTSGQRTLAIWPQGGTRNGKQILISPSTGMVGYPTPTPIGVDVTVVFNPSIVFGTTVQIETSVASCAGVWQVQSMAHTLESETFGGAWFTRLNCVKLGFLDTGGAS